MRHQLLSVIAIMVMSVSAHSYPLVPNLTQTSGDLCTTANPDFKEFRYQEQIPYCQRNVATGLKSRIYAEYGIAKRCRNRYTIDHFIPLSLGGSNQPNNLWPEHKMVKALRPDLEIDLYRQVRDGQLTQNQAIAIIVDAKLHPPTPILLDGECDTQDK